MEISKMLTISTAHITEKVLEQMDNECIWDNPNFPVIYSKFGYGYFVHIPDEDIIELYPDTPYVLYKVMQLAKDNGCEWLCIDTDGEVIDGLKTYEHNKEEE